jgi:hypothetical protein
MSDWKRLSELRIDLHRDEVRDYVRTQFPGGLRRAGISAEFTLAGAVACWRSLEPAPASPSLALIWNSLSFAGTENAACLRELLEAQDLPMPFQFIASQPHTAGVHASQVLPGLAHVTTLLHGSEGVEDLLLPALALRRPWTHVLLGEVWTPHEWQEEGDRFRARWRVLGNRS